MTTADAVLAFLRGRTHHAVTLKAILSHLKLAANERRHVKRVLAGLVDEGRVVKVSGDRYKIPADREMITGRLQVFEQGFAFVIPEEAGIPDLFLSARAAQGLAEGDRVLARVDRKGPKPRGTVVRVLERAHPRVVGRLQRYRRFCIVHPYGAKGVGPVSVAHGDEMGAGEGKVVVVEITNFPTERTGAFGRVIEILGDPGDPDVEYRVVALSFGLSTRFAPDAEAEAAACPSRVSARERKGRRDLRDVLTVTIDGESARDFDDAVSIERTGKGRFRLRVSIADVAHYVREKTALDREAYARATSVYFPDRAIPMLPEALSSGICSLKEGVERLTLTAEMDFDAAGRRTGYRAYESVIRSSARLTYTEVAGMLERGAGGKSRPAGLLESLREMEALARKLHSRRMEHGSIDFDLPEAELILNAGGKTEDIVKRERNIAHRIIEEFMLQANRVVAEHLEEEGRPLLYRVHEPPEKRDMEEFAELAAAFGFSIQPRRGVRPKELADIIAHAKGRPEEYLINQVLLRAMRQAKYSPVNAGHFGLAFDRYCHFTSPIRRYPDLVNHRILKGLLAGDAPAKDKIRALRKKLVAWGEHTSRRERQAMEAERDIVALKKTQFMAGKIGEEFDGFVSGVTKFGVFVELSEFFVEGLVPLRTLYDDDYTFHPRLHQLSGRQTKRRIRLGDPVLVRVDAVDTDRRTIDFALLARTEGAGPGMSPELERTLGGEAPGGRGGPAKRRGKGRSAGGAAKHRGKGQSAREAAKRRKRRR